jgi:hypothetical protein
MTWEEKFFLPHPPQRFNIPHNSSTSPPYIPTSASPLSDTTRTINDIQPVKTVEVEIPATASTSISTTITIPISISITRTEGTSEPTDVTVETNEPTPVIVQLKQHKSQQYDCIREAFKTTPEKCRLILHLILDLLKDAIDQAGGPIPAALGAAKNICVLMFVVPMLLPPARSLGEFGVSAVAGTASLLYEHCYFVSFVLFIFVASLLSKSDDE